MKFIINKTLLINALTIPSRVFQISKTIFPVLLNFKITLTKDNMTVIASNGDLTILNKIDCINDDGETIINISKEGEFLLNNRSIEIIKRFSGNNIEVELIDNSFIYLSDGNSQYKLNTENVNEYSDLDLSINNEFLQINAKEFNKAIQQVASAASNKELTNILSAINIEIKNGKLILNATDGNRLARKTIDVDTKKEATVNIPAKSLSEIAKMIENEDTIGLSLEENRVIFKISNITIYSNLLVSTYPDLSTIISIKYSINCLINTKELIDAMNRVALLFIDKQTSAQLIITESEFKIISRSQPFGSIEDKINDFKFDESEFKITLDCNNIIEALRAFNTDYIVMKFVGEFKPLFITSDEEPNLIQVVTPLRMNNL